MCFMIKLIETVLSAQLFKNSCCSVKSQNVFLCLRDLSYIKVGMCLYSFRMCEYLYISTHFVPRFHEAGRLLCSHALELLISCLQTRTDCGTHPCVQALFLTLFFSFSPCRHFPSAYLILSARTCPAPKHLASR